MNNRGSIRQGAGKQGQAGGRKFGKFPFKNHPPTMNKSMLACPACDFMCTSAQNLRIHTQTNHKQLENPSQMEGATAGVNPPGKIPEHIRRSVFYLKDYVYRMDREPIIGLEHILEYRLQVQPDKIETRYFCDICQQDSDLVTMLEHLCSFRHRKMYMSKQYPYVLKAPSSSKEDRMQFMRRMAMEIEQEEGTKMYRSDPTIRTTSMKSTAVKPSRWDSAGDREKRMKKALEYLQSFEIDNDSEAGTVTRLTEKLTAELKFYSDKLKEEALFPAKVARAKDVAMSIMQKAAKNRNPGQKKQMHKAPQGRPGGPPQPIVNKPFQNPNPAFQQQPQGPPFQPPNQRPNYPMPPANIQPAMPNVPPQTDQTPEEMKFLKKLMTLLKVLPQSSGTTPQTSQFTSKLMMLKSLLQDKTGSMPSNQLSMQVASLTQEMANMNNMSLNQQGNAGQLGPNVMMQMASMAKNANAQPNSNVLMQIAALLQNRQTNMNVSLPENWKAGNQQLMQMDNSSRRPMDQGPYQQPYANMGYSSGMYGGNQDCADFPSEETPYTRVSLSPRAQRAERFQDNGYNQDFRRERSQESRPSYSAQTSRPFDDPSSAERDRSYGKRLKLEGDPMTSQSAELGRHYPDDGGSTDTPNLSVDLLKRIRGKDLFTVSAILSEYADNEPK